MAKPRALGSDAILRAITEATYDVAPTDGYFGLPYKETDLDRERALATDDLLGQGRAALGAYYQRINVGGGMTVPIDVRNFGFWLHGMLGAPVTTDAAATGEFTFSAQPAVNSTITLNGTVWTFVASGASGPQTNIGVNLAATLTALASDLNGSADAEVAKCTYTATGTELKLVRDLVGVPGNSYTLARSTSPASNCVVSAPTLLGGGFQHVFTAGGDTPTKSIEVGHVGLTTPRFFLFTGCFIGGFQTDISGDGPANAQMNILGRRKILRATSIDATPTNLQTDRFQNSRAGVTVWGEAVSFLTAASLNFSNELETFNEINPDSVIGGVDPGVARTSGSMTVRLADSQTQIDLDAAIDSETPVPFAYQYTHPKRWRLVFDMPRTLISSPKAAISGPGGVEQQFTWQSEYDSVAGYGMRATLTNDVASYS